MDDLLRRIDKAIAQMPPGPQREALRATLDQRGAIIRDLASTNGATVEQALEYVRSLSRARE